MHGTAGCVGHAVGDHSIAGRRWVRAPNASVVATPNPGCMMQIGAGLIIHGHDTAVMHPIELLDESYRKAGLIE